MCQDEVPPCGGKDEPMSEPMNEPSEGIPSGPDEPGGGGPGRERGAREPNGVRTFFQVALIVAAFLLAQKLILPSLGLGT